MAIKVKSATGVISAKQVRTHRQGLKNFCASSCSLAEKQGWGGKTVIVIFIS